jgi:hypothetical protein
MGSAAGTIEPEIDALYALLLEEFTRARNALARRLRSGGDRDGGDAVARLPKPTVSAWALNQTQRQDPDLVNRLIAAGERLRDAQQGLLAGGDREPLAAAVADERRLVEELERAAERQLREAGRAASPALKTKLHDTLHATTVNPEARELLRIGRLAEDYQASDLGLGGAVAQGDPWQSQPSRASKDAARTRQVEAVRRSLEAARESERELREHAAHARRRAEEAHEIALRAQAEAERAAERARAAIARAAELDAELKSLRGG